MAVSDPLESSTKFPAHDFSVEGYDHKDFAFVYLELIEAVHWSWLHSGYYEAYWKIGYRNYRAPSVRLWCDFPMPAMAWQVLIFVSRFGISAELYRRRNSARRDRYIPWFGRCALAYWFDIPGVWTVLFLCHLFCSTLYPVHDPCNDCLRPTWWFTVFVCFVVGMWESGHPDSARG